MPVHLTFGSLFSGIGGFDLGLERAGMECRWQVEIDPFCQKVLAKHWPDVPRYGDIKTIDFTEVEPVDLICGGFPCQPVSLAGQRRGQDDERWLWPDFARAIRMVRPRYALMENVPGLLGLGMGDVLGDLSELGYDAEWSVISACSMGAPHTRERVFIMAYPNSLYGEEGLWSQSERRARAIQQVSRTKSACADWSTRMADPSALYRGAHGVSDRLERCEVLGNAIVPQVAEWIGRRIVEQSA